MKDKCILILDITDTNLKFNLEDFYKNVYQLDEDNLVVYKADYKCRFTTCEKSIDSVLGRGCHTMVGNLFINYETSDKEVQLLHYQVVKSRRVNIDKNDDVTGKELEMHKHLVEKELEFMSAISNCIDFCNNHHDDNQCQPQPMIVIQNDHYGKLKGEAEISTVVLPSDWLDRINFVIDGDKEREKIMKIIGG